MIVKVLSPQSLVAQAAYRCPLLVCLAAAIMIAGCGQPRDPRPERAGGPPGVPLVQGATVPATGDSAVASAAADTVLSQPAQVFLVAGSTAGDGNADGYAMLSHFRDPDGVAGDAYGNIYVADTGNHTIRRITPDGIVTTVAGKAGAAGSSDGRGGEARFNAPAGIRFDAAGNLYVADSKNHTIRRMAPDGMVTTVAGKAGEAGAADGAHGVARLTEPRRFDVGPGGMLYVAASLDGVIRQVSPDGAVSTLATDAPRVYSRSGGDAGLIQFGYISGIAAGLDGNLYVADALDNTIRKIAPNGHVSHVAGKPYTGNAVPPGERQVDGVGAQAQFDHLGDIVAHRDGSLSVLSAFWVRRISAAGVVTTRARFDPMRYENYLSALGLERDGGVLVTRQNLEAYHQHTEGLSAIYRVPLEGGLVPIAPKALAAPALWQDGSWILGDYSSPVAFTSVASAPEGMLYTTDGRGRLFYRDTIGRFAQRALRGDGKGGVADPRLENMAFDGMGNAYAADLFNIYKIAPDGEVSKLTAQAHSQELSGIAATAAGTIYVSAPSDGVVYRVTPQGQLEVYAGAVGDRRHADGGRLQARFASPVGLALDGAGNLYVGDADSHTVRKISLDGMVSTLAGRPGVSGSDDGAAATFTYPWSVAADRKGNVYVVESNGHSLVRRIGAGGVVSTVAGTRGVTGITMTSLAPPGRMAVAPNGDVYVISGQALLRLVMQ